MRSVSTHVLDTVSGEPAAGVAVSLWAADDGGWVSVATAVTDADGRVTDLASGLEAGLHRIRFDTGGHGNRFYPYVEVVVDLVDQRHYHIPLLLSAFGYTTYRGS